MKRGKSSAPKASRFSSSAVADPEIKLVKLNGANYSAVDTGDGYHIVRDVPVMAEIPKGTHGAPYDVTKEVLEDFLKVMASRYSDGKYAGALSIGHNDDLGMTHPDFAGFFIPRRVGKCKFAGGSEKWALYADFKIPNEVFVKFAAGKLPYHSPEIYPRSWEEKKLDIVSFLDTKPPYFDWAMNTVSKVAKDPAAKFEARWDDPSVADLKAKLLKEDLSKLFGNDLKAIASRFAVYAEEKTEEKAEEKSEEKPESAEEKKAAVKPGEAPKPEGPESEEGGQFSSDYPEAAQELEAVKTSVLKMAQSLGMNGIDSTNKKPDATPVEPEEKGETGGSKMSMDPETAAKFAAQENKVAEIEKKLAAKEREEKVSAFKAMADKKLAKKIVSAPEIIAKFAADAADMKEGGEKWFGEMVDKLSPMLKDKPPSTVAEFMEASGPSVDPANPVLSKFAAKGHDMALVARFAAQHAEIKNKLGDRFTCTVESYIENELVQSKATANSGERR